MSIEISTFCEENEIHLIGLHPNATFCQQPLDVTVFKAVKNKWNDLVTNFGFQVTRSNVCSLVGKLFDDYDFGDQIRAGFRCCGLYPFNAQAINPLKFIKTTKIPQTAIVLSSSPSPYAQEHNSTSLCELVGELDTNNEAAVGLAKSSEGSCDVNCKVPLRTSNEITATLVNDVPFKTHLEIADNNDKNESLTHFEIGNDHTEGYANSNDLQQCEFVQIYDTGSHKEMYNRNCGENVGESSGICFEQAQEPYLNAQAISFSSHREFEFAAEKHVFEKVKKILGKPLVGFMSAGTFEAHTMSEMMLLEIFKQIQPPTNAADVIKNIGRFTDVSCAYTSEAARTKLNKPTEAQIQKAAEVQIRKKLREEARAEKIEQAKAEKEKKKEEKKKMQEEKKAVEQSEKQNSKFQKKRKNCENQGKRKKIAKENQEVSLSPAKPETFEETDKFYLNLAEQIENQTYTEYFI